MLLLFIAPLSLLGQNKVHFIYDDAGNRTKKEIIISETRSAEIFTEELAQREIKIYPNPTQGQLKIEISDLGDDEEVNLTIYNVQGKKILSEKTSENYTIMDISSNPSGVYILQINIKGEISTWKIIKQ